MCNRIFYEFQVVPSVNVFSSAVLTSYFINSTGYRVDRDCRLDQFSRRRGVGGHDLFCDGSLLGRPALAAQAGAAELQASVNSWCWYTVHSCSLLIITTQIMHGMLCWVSTLWYKCRLLVLTASPSL
jgi:hypothetical protein